MLLTRVDWAFSSSSSSTAVTEAGLCSLPHLLSPTHFQLPTHFRMAHLPLRWSVSAVPAICLDNAGSMTPVFGTDCNQLATLLVHFSLIWRLLRSQAAVSILIAHTIPPQIPSSWPSDSFWTTLFCHDACNFQTNSAYLSRYYDYR